MSVNLLSDMPKTVRMDIEDENTGAVRKYYLLPKYCVECILQGHNEEVC